MTTTSRMRTLNMIFTSSSNIFVSDPIPSTYSPETDLLKSTALPCLWPWSLPQHRTTILFLHRRLVKWNGILISPPTSQPYPIPTTTLSNWLFIPSLYEILSFSIFVMIIYLPLTLTMSCSSSRWDFHFHSYVLTIYVCIYWWWNLVVFNSLVRRGYIRKVSVHFVPKYFPRDCSTDNISCSERKTTGQKQY